MGTDSSSLLGEPGLGVATPGLQKAAFLAVAGRFLGYSMVQQPGVGLYVPDTSGSSIRGAFTALGSGRESRETVPVMS